MKKLIVSLLLATIAHANDCVPLTFTTLSKMVGEPVRYERWHSLTMPLGMPPTVMDAVRAWNATQKYSRLYCIYSTVPDISFKDEGIEYDVPYLWIGTIRPDMVANPGDPLAHAAVIVFTDKGITIIHTVNQKKIMKEFIGVNELLKRTFCVFKVDHLVEFIHFETTGEVVIIDRRDK